MSRRAATLAHRLSGVGVVFQRLPHGIEQGAVDPLHNGYRAVTELRFRGLSPADPLNLGLDLLDRANRKIFPLDGIEQILALGVDGDSRFGNDVIDQLAGARESGDFVDDHRNPVAE